MLTVVILLIIVTVGCTAKTSTDEKNLSLKIGLMPAVDGAPILLAEERGYFDELNLKVDATIYTNAMNRQSALQSGELDGTMTDLISFVNNKNNGFDVKITSSTDASFPFLVSKGFQEADVKKVGIMEISVSNYLTDAFVTDKYNIEKIFITEIPTRLEMVKNNQLDMAFIPEPLASMGELSGLEKVIYENSDDFTPDVMIFTGKAITEKSEAIQLFYKAYNKAVDDINKDDSLARDILISKLQLKPEIKDMITLPAYHKARVPSEDYLGNVIDWIEKTQKIDIDLKYKDIAKLLKIKEGTVKSRLSRAKQKLYEILKED